MRKDKQNQEKELGHIPSQLASQSANQLARTSYSSLNIGES